MLTEHMFVIWSRIRIKGEVLVSETGLSLTVVYFLLTVPRWFLYCSHLFHIYVCFVLVYSSALLLWLPQDCVFSRVYSLKFLYVLMGR